MWTAKLGKEDVEKCMQELVAVLGANEEEALDRDSWRTSSSV